jgi:hypothetical protein
VVVIVVHHHQDAVHLDVAHQDAVHLDAVVAEDVVVNIYFCQQDYFLVFNNIYIKRIWKN